MNVVLFLLIVIISSFTKPVKVWKLKDSSFERAKEQYPLVLFFHTYETDEDDEQFYKEFLKTTESLEIFGINAAEINCSVSRKTCKSHHIPERSQVRYFRFVYF